MENLIIILFICIFVPLAMTLLVIRGKQRTLMAFLLIGLFVCLLASYINGFLETAGGTSRYFMTYTITPFVEEILKAIPILMFTFLFLPNKREVLECSVMTGIGFAILENAYILASNVESVSIPWAIIRGLGSGLMHGICTLFIGIGMGYIKNDARFALVGSYGLLVLSIMYHATYNLLIQSKWEYLGIILTLVTYAIIVPSFIISTGGFKQVMKILKGKN